MRMFLRMMEDRPKLNKFVRTKMRVFNYTTVSVIEQIDFTTLIFFLFLLIYR